jgi:hypothetical protein
MVRTIDHYCIRLPLGTAADMQDCVGIWFQYDQELKDFIKATLSDMRPMFGTRHGLRKDQIGSWWAELGMWWCHKRVWPMLYPKLVAWVDQHAGDWELNPAAVACPPYVAKRYARLFGRLPEQWGPHTDKQAPDYTEGTTQQETAFDDPFQTEDKDTVQQDPVFDFKYGEQMAQEENMRAAEESSRAQAAAYTAWQLRMQAELEERIREQGRKDAEHRRKVRELYDEQQKREWHQARRTPPPAAHRPTVLSVLDVYSLSLMGLGWPYTADQLRTEYRTRCRAAHPDTGGSEEAFKRLQAAYKHVQGIRT